MSKIWSRTASRVGGQSILRAFSTMLSNDFSRELTCSIGQYSPARVSSSLRMLTLVIISSRPNL